MTPDAVLKAAESVRQIEEIGTWYPQTATTYLILSKADPEGPVKDPLRLFLRLNREELDVVTTALLTYHERILASLGVAVEEPSV